MGAPGGKAAIAVNLRSELLCCRWAAPTAVLLAGDPVGDVMP